MGIYGHTWDKYRIDLNEESKVGEDRENNIPEPSRVDHTKGPGNDKKEKEEAEKELEDVKKKYKLD